MQQQLLSGSRSTELLQGRRSCVAPFQPARTPFTGRLLLSINGLLISGRSLLDLLCTPLVIGGMVACMADTMLLCMRLL